MALVYASAVGFHTGLGGGGCLLDISVSGKNNMLSYMNLSCLMFIAIEGHSSFS